MTAHTRPYTNPSTNEEKAEALRNEQRLRKQEASKPTTLHALSRLGQDEEPAGRFAQARYITGSEAATKYPAASTPWTAQADPGVEAPLGYSVNDLEPTGEAHEVEQSLAIGEPETGAITHPACLNQPLKSAAEVSGSPPELAGDSVSLTPAVAEAPLVASPTASVETSPANPLNAPDDGLPDCPRRIDGTPMSNSVETKMRKL